MSQQFDPYHKWLGIPAKDQPANHYRLLGVELLEPDLDVIENAADQRMRHVRSFQSGQHQAESQQLLNEIAAAKLVLLDPERKADYDRQFVQPVPVGLAVEQVPVEAAPEFHASAGHSSSRRRAKPRNAAVELAKIAAGGIAGTLLALVLLGFLREDWDKLGIARLVRGQPSQIDVDPEVIPPGQVPELPDEPVDQSPPARTDKQDTPDKKESVEKPPVGPKLPPARPIDIAAAPSLPAARGVPSFTFARWEKGQPEQLLGPVAENFVVSSILAGHLLGNGEWYDINIVDLKGVPHWRLQGSGAMAIAAGATAIRTPLRGWFEDKVEIKRWLKGEPPVKLIHQHDGFAVLSGVHGCFLGPEEVRVHLAADGFWYLSGKTGHDTRARAIIYRFKVPGKLRAIVTEHPLKPGDNLTPLRFEDAICSISRITGRFQGFGEALHCEVQNDLRWVFKCHSLQTSTAGTVISVALDTPAIIELANNNEPPMATPVETPAGKQVAPDEAAQTAARAALTDQLSGTANEIMSRANNRLPAERYVLLLAARDKAAAEGQCTAAMQAVDALDKAFEVDNYDVTTETLLQLRSGCQTPEANRQLALLTIQHFDRGVQLEKTESLRSLAELALAAARAGEDPDLQRRATLKLLEIRK